MTLSFAQRVSSLDTGSEGSDVMEILVIVVVCRDARARGLLCREGSYIFEARYPGVNIGLDFGAGRSIENLLCSDLRRFTNMKTALLLLVLSSVALGRQTVWGQCRDLSSNNSYEMHH